MSTAVTRPLEWSPPKTAISRVPYLPGLDGMRALAVVAVMVYHADNSWLPGGFLGVEVFFVISGYLITLLLIGEHERTGTVDLGQFWLRRARRLLPALFVLVVGLTIYTTLFRRDALGQLRGDVIAALAYVSNWYQIWVGQGYTATGDFAPLRHLWSLGVEEQYYLLWPLVMVGLIRLGRRRLPDLSRWLFLAAVGVTVLMALLYHPGQIESCAVTPEAYWEIGERCISKVDALYLGTFTRAGGLLLGGAFAMIWRPVALMRGPMRDKGGLLDLIAIIGLAGLAALCWYLHIVTPEGADPWLFRGGFLLTGISTLLVMAAVTHLGAFAGPVLGNPVLLWIGTRSYGLYLFHWPVYQIIRRVAGNPLTVGQFVLAMAITLPITELSYRLVETPIRKRHVGRWWQRLQRHRDPTPRRMIAGAGAGLVALSVFAAANLATAELKQNEIAESMEEGGSASGNLTDLVPAAATTDAPPAATVPPSTAEVAAPAPATTVERLPRRTTTVPTTAPAVAAPGSRPRGARDEKPPVAIGDSVMRGAAPDLAAAGIFVNAEENRQMKSMVPIVRQLVAQDGFGDVVVVHLGTNGPIEDETVDAFFTGLRDIPRVVVMTIRCGYCDWTASNNAKLFDVPNRFDNVELIDWGGLANSCPGDCFYDDGIHLAPDGSRYYTQLITETIGM